MLSARPLLARFSPLSSSSLDKLYSVIKRDGTQRAAKKKKKKKTKEMEIVAHSALPVPSRLRKQLRDQLVVW